MSAMSGLPFIAFFAFQKVKTVNKPLIWLIFLYGEVGRRRLPLLRHMSASKEHSDSRPAYNGIDASGWSDCYHLRRNQERSSTLHRAATTAQNLTSR